MKETEQQRLSKPAQPMPSWPRGTPVSVCMGAGWKKGRVSSYTRHSITVDLDRERKQTTCSDARNIKKL